MLLGRAMTCAWRTAQNVTEKLGRLAMSRSALALVAAMLLSGFVFYPHDADAATFCAQLRGAKTAGHPDCSFSTMNQCRARVRHRGGGHCFKMRA